MKFLGIDLETTGLDPTRDRILEVAVAALDEDFAVLTEWQAVIKCPFAEGLVGSFVREMHTNNGLFAEVKGEASVDLATAEAILVALVGAAKPMLLGNTVHFDRGFLKHWMPLLESKLHHRHCEVSTLRDTLGLVVGDGPPNHRAADDLAHAIHTARAAAAFRGGK